jgi:ketol-acid reductoisomerase
MLLMIAPSNKGENLKNLYLEGQGWGKICTPENHTKNI